MHARRPFVLAAPAAGIAVTIALFSSSAPTAEGRDRTPPTRPTNLRITATTAWSVSLAWNASSDNSGQFTYRVQCSNGHTMTVPSTSTSCMFTSGFQHRWTYSFVVYAIDAAGNRSQNSNSVSVTLPRDTTPPSAPVITVTDVGPTHVIVSLSSTDDGPFIFYSLFRDGVAISQGSSATSTTVYLLQPETTYTFTAQARDNGINWSAISVPLSVTTEAPNPNDTTPPTTPTNLNADTFGDGSTEFELRWTASTDDFDAQAFIRYDVYLNGTFIGATVGRNRINDYGVFGENTAEVIAVDTAGNESPAATLTFNIIQ